MKLPAVLRGRERVVLDTMLFIYLFEDDPVRAPRVEFLLEAFARGVCSGVITPVTAAEILVKPLRAGRADLADRYREALGALVNIGLSEFDAETGWMAAALRAKYRLPLPDMFQAAAALRSPRPALITNDAALRRVREMPVVLLDELET